MKTARDDLFDALMDDWRAAVDALYPDGRRTRDDKAVAAYVLDRGRNDVSEIVESVLPMDRSDLDDVRDSWQGYHPQWARRIVNDIVDRAIELILDVRRDARRKRREKLAKKRRGRRGRGRPPRRGPVVLNLHIKKLDQLTPLSL